MLVARPRPPGRHRAPTAPRCRGLEVPLPRAPTSGSCWGVGRSLRVRVAGCSRNRTSRTVLPSDAGAHARGDSLGQEERARQPGPTRRGVSPHRAAATPRVRDANTARLSPRCGCEARNAQEPHGGGRSGSVAPGETPGCALAGACAKALPERPGAATTLSPLGPGGGEPTLAGSRRALGACGGETRPAACLSCALGIYSKVKEKCQGERLPKHQAPLPGPFPLPLPLPLTPSLPSPTPHLLPPPTVQPPWSQLLQDEKVGEGGGQDPIPLSSIIQDHPHLRCLGRSCACRGRIVVVPRRVYLLPPTSCSQGRG